MLLKNLGAFLVSWFGRSAPERHPVQFDIKRGRIILPRYSYPASGPRAFERPEIVEIIDWYPLALLTTDGEFVLIDRDKRDAAIAFCAAGDVPFTARYDVWSDLLEPFLDTEHSEDWQVKTDAAIRRAGFSDAEITDIRARVQEPMLSMTAITWEWTHYGLSDVLVAMKPGLIPNQQKWADFYAEAMEIAGRGILAPSPLSPLSPGRDGLSDDDA